MAWHGFEEATPNVGQARCHERSLDGSFEMNRRPTMQSAMRVVELAMKANAAKVAGT
jgi:hypothetical protein